MKIYSRKSLMEGLFFLVVGCINILLLIGQGDGNSMAENVKSIILASLGLIVGSVEFYYAFSQKGAKEIKRELGDERNQLITWQSESLAFRVMMMSMALFLIGAAILWKYTQSQVCLGAIVVIGVLWTYMWFLQIICFVIKERRN